MPRISILLIFYTLSLYLVQLTLLVLLSLKYSSVLVIHIKSSLTLWLPQENGKNKIFGFDISGKWFSSTQRKHKTNQHQLQWKWLIEEICIFSSCKISYFRMSHLNSYESIVYLVRIFPHSDWIRARKTPNRNKFCDTIKYGLESTLW